MTCFQQSDVKTNFRLRFSNLNHCGHAVFFTNFFSQWIQSSPQCNSIFGLAQNIWIDTKHFRTYRRTRQCSLILKALPLTKSFHFKCFWRSCSSQPRILVLVWVIRLIGFTTVETGIGWSTGLEIERGLSEGEWRIR